MSVVGKPRMDSEFVQRLRSRSAPFGKLVERKEMGLLTVGSAQAGHVAVWVSMPSLAGEVSEDLQDLGA